LTVTESSPADSRQWKYSTESGGPYNQIIAGATGTSYTPGFSAWGTYYVVCVSTKDAIAYTSNEVKIYLPVFLEQTSISLAGVRGSVAWGDYDNDGDLDVLVAGYTASGNISKIYRNDNGIFTDINAGLTGTMQCSAAWGDYDNDGDLDLLLAGYISSNNYFSKIYRNDAGVFTDINAGLAGVSVGSADWGDYDNDGDLDILISGRTGSTSFISRVYRNDNGVLTGAYMSSAAWGDYDNDGDQDILLTGYVSESNRISKIYRNDNGVFTDINAGLTGVYYGSVDWGDYDNDGDLDILLTGISTAGNISAIYRNDSGVFTDIIAGLPDVYLGSVAWGDYDNDGDLDVLITGISSIGYISKVYMNVNGVFTDINAGLTGVYYGSVAWGDYDNDGNLDILLSGYTSSDYITKIFRNTNILAHTSPAAPANLQTTPISLSKVTLSWDKASDLQTPQNTLTYNIRIGTTAGGSNIVGPMASVSTGFRRVPARGNAEFKNNGYVIGNLAPGTYYWSVQAIDQSFAGGDWATESSFTLLAAPVAGDANSITQTSLTANWSSSTGATGYRLDVTTDPTFATFVTGYNNKDAGNLTSANVTGLTANTTYYYRIRAYNAGGTSIISSNVIKTPTLIDVPAIPEANAATDMTKTSFTANWTSSPTATGYRLDVATDNSFTTFVTDYNDIDVGNVTNKSITGLTLNTEYFYRVRAYNAGGPSGNSSTILATTISNVPLPPTANEPSSILQTSFTANWSSSATATGYRLDVATDNTFTSFLTGYNDKNVTNVTNYNVTELTVKTIYYYRVRAYNSGGTSGNSDTITVTTLPNPPATPAGFTASSCNNMVTLTWNANSEPDFLRYRIYSSTTVNPTTKIDSTTNQISETTKIISGLTGGQTYYFRVSALILPGVESALSTSASVKVKTGVIPKIKAKWNDVLISYNLGDSIAGFQWYNGNTAIANATRQYYVTNKQPGNYHVLATDKSGCQNTSNIIIISSAKSLSVFPNPATTSFVLSLNSETQGKTIVCLYNSSGIKVLEYRTEKINSELYSEIPINNLQSGIYTIEVSVNNKEIDYSRIVIIK
jgi:predicted nucleotidyltransferase